MGIIKQKMTILFSICSEEENISQYYLSVVQDNTVSQITKAVFDQLKVNINGGKYILITIIAKIIKTVGFTACISGTPHMAAISLAWVNQDAQVNH